GIEGIDLTRAAAHEQEDDAFGLAGVGQIEAVLRRGMVLRSGEDAVFQEQMRQGQPAEAEADLLQHLTARQGRWSEATAVLVPVRGHGKRILQRASGKTRSIQIDKLVRIHQRLAKMDQAQRRRSW